MSSSSAALRQRPNSKQQQMLRGIQQQRREEQEEWEALKDHHEHNLSQSISTLLRGLATIVIIGVAALYYVSPEHLTSLWKRLPQLPTRHLLLLFPTDTVVVKRHLPRVFANYAVATPENAPARQLLQEAQSIRRVATDRGPYYKQQQVQLHSWEILGDFLGQLPTPEQQDGVCGQGFAQAFAKYAETDDDALRQRARHDLVIFCMLSLGTHDGFVRWNTTVEASLTRGLRGLVAISSKDNRAYTDVLLLPILSNEQLEERQRAAETKGNKLPPSTLVPVKTLVWLTQQSPQTAKSLEEYTRSLGGFLYKHIQQEGDVWVHLEAACTPEDRARLHPLYRRIATTCRIAGRHDDAASGVPSKDCCSYYDPSIKPFPQRKRWDDDDSDNDD